MQSWHNAKKIVYLMSGWLWLFAHSAISRNEISYLVEQVEQVLTHRGVHARGQKKDVVSIDPLKTAGGIINNDNGSTQITNYKRQFL